MDLFDFGLTVNSGTFGIAVSLLYCWKVREMPRILVLYYSMYGHVKKLADQIAEGVRQEGCEVVVYQAPETLSEDVLKLLKAPPKPSDPVFTFDKHSVLAEADGVLFGFPTRFGMMCAQMKAVFDSFGHLWQSGALATKPAGLFFSTGSQGGGQETTAFTTVTQLAHLGMVFVPLGTYDCSEPSNTTYQT